jgi:hypothetical protein
MYNKEYQGGTKRSLPRRERQNRGSLERARVKATKGGGYSNIQWGDESIYISVLTRRGEHNSKRSLTAEIKGAKL